MIGATIGLVAGVFCEAIGFGAGAVDGGVETGNSIGLEEVGSRGFVSSFGLLPPRSRLNIDFLCSSSDI